MTRLLHVFGVVLDAVIGGTSGEDVPHCLKNRFDLGALPRSNDPRPQGSP